MDAVPAPLSWEERTRRLDVLRENAFRRMQGNDIQFEVRELYKIYKERVEYMTMVSHLAMWARIGNNVLLTEELNRAANNLNTELKLLQQDMLDLLERDRRMDYERQLAAKETLIDSLVAPATVVTAVMPLLQKVVASKTKRKHSKKRKK